jgi:predicted alpha/beta superfamily hydrolase
MQDGQNLFDPQTAFGGQDWRIDVTADDLILRGAIEPLIVVGIYNTGVRRISEYTPTKDPRRRKGGKGDRYARMMTQELKPFIDREYRTRKSAAHTGVGGSSLGALVSLETGLLYPRVFGRLAILSPSVWWDNRSILDMVRAYKSDTRARIWLDSGTEEGDAPRTAIADLKLLCDASRKRAGERVWTSVAPWCRAPATMKARGQPASATYCSTCSRDSIRESEDDHSVSRRLRKRPRVPARSKTTGMYHPPAHVGESPGKGRLANGERR